FRVRSMVALPASAEPEPPPRAPRASWLHAHTPALGFALVALVFSWLAWHENTLRAADGTPLDVVLTAGGVLVWAVSVARGAGMLLIDWPNWRQRAAPERGRRARPWWRRSDGLAVAGAVV